MYSKVLGPALVIGIIVGLVYGCFAFILVMLLSLLVPLPAMYVTGRVADFVLMLYSGGSTRITLQDQLAGEVEKIKFLRRENKLTEALEQAEVVLTQDPEHPEALLLKAQILFEGFAEYSAANTCLRQIIAMEPPPDEKLLNWAKSLREDILLRIRERAEQEPAEDQAE